MRFLRKFGGDEFPFSEGTIRAEIFARHYELAAFEEPCRFNNLSTDFEVHVCIPLLSEYRIPCTVSSVFGVLKIFCMARLVFTEFNVQPFPQDNLPVPQFQVTPLTEPPPTHPRRVVVV